MSDTESEMLAKLHRLGATSNQERGTVQSWKPPKVMAVIISVALFAGGLGYFVGSQQKTMALSPDGMEWLVGEISEKRDILPNAARDLILSAAVN